MSANYNTMSENNQVNTSIITSLVFRYNSLLSSTRTHTRNVLQAWQNKFDDIQQFVQQLLIVKKDEILSLPQCGRRSAEDILSIQRQLREINGMEHLIDENESSMVTEGACQIHHLPSNIDILLPILQERMNEFDTRPRNCINRIFRDCKNSIATFYNRILTPDYLSQTYQAGKKSMPEILRFCDNTREYIEQFADEASVSLELRKYQMVAELGLPQNIVDELLQKERKLGYFPMFYAIRLYLENLSEEEMSLINNDMHIYQNQTLQKRQHTATNLNRTIEMVRLKRAKLIENLSMYFKKYSSLGFASSNPYYCLMRHFENEINMVEETNFSLDFITWVIGCVYNDFTLIGSPIKTIGASMLSNQHLSVVPTKLINLFDFEGFIKRVYELNGEKRSGEHRVSVKELMRPYLKVQSCEDRLFEIEEACRTILLLQFPMVVESGHVILTANKNKTLQMIVEEILRNAGRIMTLDEITKEYRKLYPGKKTADNSLHSALNGNKNILPIGRSSTYTLAEWDKPELRGGTIRMLVQECIDLTNEKIASTKKICDYVMRFRPDTNERSILSNISLDSKKELMFFCKNGERYLGYANKKYSTEYFPVEKDAVITMNNSIYYPMLLSFIQKNHRFPFSSSSDTQENLLYTFWRRQGIRYKQHTLDNHSMLYHEKIQSMCGEYKMGKDEYEWKVQLAHAYVKYNIPVDDLNLLKVKPLEDVEIWLFRNLNDYFYRQTYTSSKRLKRLVPLAEKFKSSYRRSKASQQFFCA